MNEMYICTPSVAEYLPSTCSGASTEDSELEQGAQSLNRGEKWGSQWSSHQVASDRGMGERTAQRKEHRTHWGISGNIMKSQDNLSSCYMEMTKSQEWQKKWKEFVLTKNLGYD